ncbi:hypothetical protein DmGdi_23130 [Gluconobacter sp. Gdi]|nr:hypothetical protein DmGdi_23130 [Gluconobacter sp. Gdi]
MAIAPKLDRIDLKILAQLQKNGRLTNVELANRVGSVCQSMSDPRQAAGSSRLHCGIWGADCPAKNLERHDCLYRGHTVRSQKG